MSDHVSKAERACVVPRPMNPLLASLCAQLRVQGNCPTRLGDQAADALESLWRDNVRLSTFVLETEVAARRTIDESAEVSRYGALR
jgi:hypothetical protein